MTIVFACINSNVDCSQTGHIRTSHGSYFIEPLSPTSDEYLKKKATEKVSGNGSNSAGRESTHDINDDHEILHEIYQVGLDLPATASAAEEKDEKTAGSRTSSTTTATEEDYSYESSDNLQIGSPTYEDEDEEDDYWLNPGGLAPKPTKLPKSNLEAKSRTKRSMSRERFVELSVVTDKSSRWFVLFLLLLCTSLTRVSFIGFCLSIDKL